MNFARLSFIITLFIGFFSTLFVSAQICNKSQLPANLQNGLVAFYPFCGNANDISGNGNNGTVMGGVTLTPDRFGNPNNAYSFPGNSSSYIECGLSQSLRVSNAITMAAWIYLDGGSLNPRIISSEPNFCAGYQMSTGGTSNISRNLGALIVNNNGVGVGVNFSSITALEWHHVVMTADQNGIGNLYIDGVNVNSVNGSPILNPTYCSNLNIGRKSYSAFDAFGGKMDDVGIWNRALSAQEVLTLFNSNCTLNGYNPLLDTIKVCGSSTTLDAGAGFATYSWSNSATTRTITPTSSGFYKVTVTNAAGCTASDSTYLSLVNANIINRDTTICRGASIKLSIDSLFPGQTPCTSASLPANLRNGLVAYYPFCGNANDESGNGYNGTVIGANLIPDRYGRGGNAYRFNGVSNYIEVPSLNNMTYKPITYSAWFNTSTLFNTPNQAAGAIIGRDQPGNYSQGVLCLYSERASGLENELMYYTGDPQPISTVSIAKSKINTSQWYHVVYTMEANGDWKFYINGKLTNSGPLAVAQFKNLPFRIGSSDGRFFWNGSLDDLGVWNRVLSSSEINQLYEIQPSVTWSTGATTNSITVSPTQTTTYYVTVSDGITTCTDSVKVTVSDITGFNPLQDTVKVCGSTTTLDAGSGYTTYSWSNGATTRTIAPTTSGFYKVTVTNAAGCTASDSTYLSLVNANIINRDTTICRGTSVTLRAATNTLSVTDIDGNVYPVVKIGRQNWLGANLRSSKFSNRDSISNIIDGVSWYLTTNDSTPAWSSINHDKTLDSLRGKLYNWYAVNDTRNICPAGWHVPTDQEWDTLIKFLDASAVFNINGVQSNIAGGALKDTNNIYWNWGNIGATNSTGFSARPAGIRGYYGNFYGGGDGIFIWTNTSNGQYHAFFKAIDAYSSSISRGTTSGIDNKSVGGSVRCLNTSIQSNYTYQWSTGATTNSITLSPTQTTTYYLTVSDGITTCTDSVKITVSDITGFNPLQDTVKVCGTTTTLDAGAGFATYSWSNGASTRTITPTTSGFYKVTVTNAAGCTASDSTYLSLVGVCIINNDTTICKGTQIEINTNTTCLNGGGGNNSFSWQLLIPNTAFNGNEINVSPSGYDKNTRMLYSVVKNNTINRVYAINLNNNTVSSLMSNNAPGELYTYAYDKINNRLVASRVGRDAVYALPISGGTWQPIGSGGFDAENYGSNSFWNPVSNRFAFIGGYGFYSVKNWVWENNGSGWLNTYPNNSNCVFPKRGWSSFKIAPNETDNKIFIFSGAGSCDGNQYASSCSLGSSWNALVGMYCWLRDLWELDLATYKFTNILPVNDQSIKREGAFAYDYHQNTFYNIGGRAPTSTWNVYTPYSMNVDRFRRGVDPGFVNIPTSGTPPPADRDGIAFYDGYGRIIYARNDGIWALNLLRTPLGDDCNLTYRWSTGDTTEKITVSPTQTTTYYVTVSDGITTCTDSVKVTVSDLAGFNPLQDTVKVCGSTTTLDAGAGFATYSWSNGATTRTITPTTSGFYKVTVTNAAGCTASDSTYLSMVNANIINRDTTICRGASLNLYVDSTINGKTFCNLTDIQPNLRNGLLGYWPFCNNLNDVSGNARHATNYGAVFSKDRFGNPGNAMGFSLSAIVRQYLTVPGINVSGPGSTGMSLSLWYKRLPQSTNVSTLFRQEGSCNFPDFLIQSRNTGIETGIRTTGYSSSFSNYTIDTNWHMISFTYDRAQLRTYLDGNLIATQARTGTVSFLENISYIGICGSLVDHQFAGYIDDIGIWNRPLSAQELNAMINGNQTTLTQCLWSTGATTNSITVSPTQNTTYYATVSDGITTCTDSVKVTVTDIAGFNPLQDTIKVCGTNTTLDAGAGFATYSWSNGASTRTIAPNSSGFYNVTVTNAAGCTASDSTYLSMVNANIINRDTTICRGASIKLSIDSLFPLRRTPCNASGLPSNLRNGLVAYYPFCGNANDASGSGNNGTVNGATLTTDRFGEANKAYSFDGVNDFISTAYDGILGSNPRTISLWLKTNTNRLSEGMAAVSWGKETAVRGDRFDAYFNYFTAGATANISDAAITYSTPIPVNNNQWNHYVFMLENSKNKLSDIKVYQNGILLTTIAHNYDDRVTIINTLPGGPILIGRISFGPDPNFLEGQLDDILIYERALSEQEILQLYRQDQANVTWSTGATTNSIMVSPTQTTTYTVTVSDGITTCTDNVRVTVTSVDTAVAVLDPPVVCSATGGNVRIQANASTGHQYQWLLNGAAIQGATNRLYTATQAGQYRVVLINATGCRDTSRIITITTVTTPTVTQPGNQSVCNGSNTTAITFSGSVAGTVYDWTNNNSSIGLLSSGTGNIEAFKAINTSAAPVTATITVTPKYTNTGITCLGTPRTFTITVNPTPVATITPPVTTVICEGSSITLTATGGSTYQWFLNGNQIIGVSGSTYAATQPGAYTVVPTSATNCKGQTSSAINLSLIKRPTADFSFGITCAGFATNFTNLSQTSNSGDVAYAWSFGNGGVSIQSSPSTIYNQPGSYTVTLVATPNACPLLTSTVNKTVIIQSPPANIRYSGKETADNKDLLLESRSFSGATYQWVPPVGLNNPNTQNPVFNYNKEQQYLIRITTPQGCVITDTLLVRVYTKRDIYVPDAFTPNGDGSNDVMIPRLVGIKDLTYYKVYDRWGQVMFETDKKNTGWDGTFRGVKQPMETYVWIAEGVDIDGNRVKRSGSTILIR